MPTSDSALDLNRNAVQTDAVVTVVLPAPSLAVPSPLHDDFFFEVLSAQSSSQGVGFLPADNKAGCRALAPPRARAGAWWACVERAADAAEFRLRLSRRTIATAMLSPPLKNHSH